MFKICLLHFPSVGCLVWRPLSGLRYSTLMTTGEFFERKRTETRKSTRKSYQTDGHVSSIHDILPISIFSRDLPEDSTSIAEAEYARRVFFQ